MAIHLWDAEVTTQNDGGFVTDLVYVLNVRGLLEAEVLPRSRDFERQINCSDP